jgi:hypothetical protein
MPWWLHGIVLGLVASIPMAIPVLHDPKIYIGTFVMGALYGFLTELITSLLFKAKPVGTVTAAQRQAHDYAIMKSFM